VSDRPLPPSMGGARNTPEKGQDVVVRATTEQAVPPEVLPKLKHGVPPEEGIPPEEGVPPEQGVPEDEGTPIDEGVVPGSDGQMDVGAPGQVDLGAPGQVDIGAPGSMLPWEENPWAPEEAGFEGSAEEDALADDVWPENDEDAGVPRTAFFTESDDFLELPELEEGAQASDDSAEDASDD